MNVTVNYTMNKTLEVANEIASKGIAWFFDLGLFWNVASAVIFVAVASAIIQENRDVSRAIAYGSYAAIIYLVAMTIIQMVLGLTMVNWELIVVYGLLVMASFMLKWNSQY